MNSYERLRAIMQSQQVCAAIDTAFWDIKTGRYYSAYVLSNLAEELSGSLGLSGEVHHNAIVFYHLSSRGKQPACIVVSMNAGQSSSPSASAYRRTAHALIQVFEGDADDRELAEHSPVATHWIETKGRVLFH